MPLRALGAIAKKTEILMNLLTPRFLCCGAHNSKPCRMSQDSQMLHQWSWVYTGFSVRCDAFTPSLCTPREQPLLAVCSDAALQAAKIGQTVGLGADDLTPARSRKLFENCVSGTLRQVNTKAGISAQYLLRSCAPDFAAPAECAIARSDF